MAILKEGDMAVARRADGRVLLRITGGERKRDIIMEPDAAQTVGTKIANAGLDQTEMIGRYPRIIGTRVIANRKEPDLVLELQLEAFGGPVVARIEPDLLLQLVGAAGEALGLLKPGDDIAGRAEDG
ncbi:hypothetical protein [Novosphingobium clariflavum]|uniref:Uncharacterized protein n=1 Tax=Novosphingobium clariflavum TaxID=2029884 RepID=A0ABV6S5Z7_9SPHN|nr:hypothetical protein [Novosphingobium clariflavum]